MRAMLWIGRMAATAAGMTLATVVALAQQPSGSPPPMSAAEQAMMEKWQAFATPGQEHGLLAARVGTWNIKISMWNDPAAPVQTSQGTSTMSLILGGRYLQDVTHSTYNGMPFEGQGLTGYDNLKKKFVATWIDNMGTGLMIAEGTYDAATKTYTSLGESPDPMAGKYVKFKTVDTTLGPDHWTSVMYSQTPDGTGWWKVMEMDYTRKK